MEIKNEKILFNDILPGDVVIIAGIKSLVLSKSAWTNTIMVLYRVDGKILIAEHYMKTGIILISHIDISIGLESLCIRAGLDSKEIINH